MRNTLIAILLAGLCACAPLTPEERAALMERQVDAMIRSYAPACEKLGYKADTDAWRNCILRLDSTANIQFQGRRSTMTSCWGHRGFYQCSTY